MSDDASPQAPPDAPTPGRRRVIFKGVVQLALGLALFAGLVWWVSPPWDELRDTIDLHPQWLCLSLLGSAFATVVTAARWKMLSETMGAGRLPYGIYFHYLALTRVIGQVLPTVLVDVLGRGAALKAAGSDSRLGQLITPVVLERLIDLLLPLALLAWALAVHLDAIPWIDPWLSLGLCTAVFVALAIALMEPLVGLALWAYGTLRRLRRRDRSLARPKAPRVDPPLAARIVGLSVLRYAGILVQYWGAGAGLGVLLAPLVLVSAAPLAQLAGLVGITPGGLGVQEGGWAAALHQLGQREAHIVVFMAGTRLMMSVNFGILSLLSWPWRGKRTESA
ncbi:MAG: lysylphosphatidylglycerol synthase transmembrane domain-containing protein [Myxococcota bacterium]